MKFERNGHERERDDDDDDVMYSSDETGKMSMGDLDFIFHFRRNVL